MSLQLHPGDQIVVNELNFQGSKPHSLVKCNPYIVYIKLINQTNYERCKDRRSYLKYSEYSVINLSPFRVSIFFNLIQASEVFVQNYNVLEEH